MDEGVNPKDSKKGGCDATKLSSDIFNMKENTSEPIKKTIFQSRKNKSNLDSEPIQRRGIKKFSYQTALSDDNPFKVSS